MAEVGNLRLIFMPCSTFAMSFESRPAATAPRA
jgi:hypothetical protein